MRNQKNLRRMTGMLIVMAGLFFPLSVRAQESDLPDSVILQQQEDKIAVFVNINNAHADGISALSLRLKVDNAKTTADFSFDDSLAQCGVAESLYESGTLSLYAASDEGLFPDSGLLKLGELKVMPQADGQRLQISVQYVNGSLQAVNSGYGAIAPIVRIEPEPVSMLVGEGVTYGSGDDSGYTQPPIPEIPDDGGSSSDETEPSDEKASPGENASSGETKQDGDRTQEGLYDEHTQYVNDPAEAQDIPSGVVHSSSQAGLTDLSQTGSGNSGPNLQAGGFAAGLPSAAQNVTVVSPAEGPSGLLVSAGASDMGNAKAAAGTSGMNSMAAEGGSGSTAASSQGTAAHNAALAGGSKNGADAASGGASAAASIAASGGASAAASGGDGVSAAQTISFDQKNGGAVETNGAAEKESGKRTVGKLLLTLGLVGAAVLVTAMAVRAILLERRRRLRRKRALARAGAKKRNGKKRAA